MPLTLPLRTFLLAAMALSLHPLSASAQAGAWQKGTMPDGLTLQGVAVLDASNALAVGWDGRVLRTSDRGATWTAPVVPSPVNDVAVVSFTLARIGPVRSPSKAP